MIAAFCINICCNYLDSLDSCVDCTLLICEHVSYKSIYTSDQSCAVTQLGRPSRIAADATGKGGEDSSQSASASPRESIREVASIHALIIIRVSEGYDCSSLPNKFPPGLEMRRNWLSCYPELLGLIHALMITLCV